MKITKKDMMYLKWLVLFVFLYAFWTFAWLPMSTNLEAKQAELANLKLAQTVAQTTIPTYQATINQEITVKAEAQELFSKFFDVGTPAQMEDYLIPILSQHNGRITYFEVADAMVVIPQTTLQSKEQMTYKIKELVDQYNDITAPTTEIPVTESQLLKSKITYILDISFTDYQDLLRTIDAMDMSILLSSSSYQLSDATAELVFDIYSIEKISIAE